MGLGHGGQPKNDVILKVFNVMCSSIFNMFTSNDKVVPLIFQSGIFFAT